jgi:hypothetical protein
MITAHAFTPDAFAGDGGIREELAAGVKRRGQAWLPGSIQNGPRRLRRIKGLQWQTLVRGDIGRQRLFRPLANPGEVGRAHRTSNGFTEMKRLTALTLTAALALSATPALSWYHGALKHRDYMVARPSAARRRCAAQCC